MYRVFKYEDRKEFGLTYFKNLVDRLDSGVSIDLIPELFKTEKTIETGTVIVFDCTAYTVACAWQGKNMDKVVFVSECRHQEYFINNVEPILEYEDRYVCPYCGYVNDDSGEMIDSDDEFICPDCGSVTSYYTEKTIDFTVSPVKMTTVVKVEQDDLI